MTITSGDLDIRPHTIKLKSSKCDKRKIILENPCKTKTNEFRT